VQLKLEHTAAGPPALEWDPLFSEGNIPIPAPNTAKEPLPSTLASKFFVLVFFFQTLRFCTPINRGQYQKLLLRQAT